MVITVKNGRLFWRIWWGNRKIPSRKADKQTEKVGMNGLDTFFCTMLAPGEIERLGGGRDQATQFVSKTGNRAKYIKKHCRF